MPGCGWSRRCRFRRRPGPCPRRRRPPSRCSSRPARAPARGIPGRTVGRLRAGGAERELVQVALADDDRPGRRRRAVTGASATARCPSLSREAAVVGSPPDRGCPSVRAGCRAGDRGRRRAPAPRPAPAACRRASSASTVMNALRAGSRAVIVARHSSTTRRRRLLRVAAGVPARRWSFRRYNHRGVPGRGGEPAGRRSGRRSGRQFPRRRPPPRCRQSRGLGRRSLRRPAPSRPRAARGWPGTAFPAADRGRGGRAAPRPVEPVRASRPVACGPAIRSSPRPGTARRARSAPGRTRRRRDAPTRRSGADRPAPPRSPGPSSGRVR